MIKRTMGRLLLTALVITGLAGTFESSSLTSAERKFLINELKDSKAELQKTVKGLSAEQMEFRTDPDRWNIRECIYHIALTDNTLWSFFEQTMKGPVNSEKRAEIKLSDEEVLKMVTDRSKTASAPESIQPAKATWKNTGDAVEELSNNRAKEIKYIKATTDDLRNRVVKLPIGHADAYQILVFMSGHAKRHTAQINEIKSHPNFPK